MNDQYLKVFHLRSLLAFSLLTGWGMLLLGHAQTSEFVQPHPFPVIAQTTHTQNNHHFKAKHTNTQNNSPAAFKKGDRRTTVTLAAARKFMMDELAQTPALKEKIQRIGEIQQQRMVLQRERVRLAENEGLDRRKTLEQFHESLKKDDQLSNQLRQVVRDLLAAAPVIQSQIKARKFAIKARLAALGNPSDEGSSASAEARKLNRALRLYDFWSTRIQSLKENPERVDLLMRFMRGWSMGDGHDHAIEKLQQRMDDLRKQKHDLERRVDETNKELDSLRKQMKSLEADWGTDDQGHNWPSPGRMHEGATSSTLPENPGKLPAPGV
jgi:hypothetical protein